MKIFIQEPDTRTIITNYSNFIKNICIGKQNGNSFLIKNNLYNIELYDNDLKFYFLTYNNTLYVLLYIMKDIWKLINVQQFNLLGSKITNYYLYITNEYCYLNIPKNGTSTIKKLPCFIEYTNYNIRKEKIRKKDKTYVENILKNSNQYYEIINKFKYQNIYKFAIIRDPIERFCSGLAMLIRFNLKNNIDKLFGHNFINFYIDMILRELQIFKKYNELISINSKFFVREDKHIVPQSYLINIQKILFKKHLDIDLELDNLVQLKDIKNFIEQKLNQQYSFFSITGVNNEVTLDILKPYMTTLHYIFDDDYKYFEQYKYLLWKK